MFRFHISAVTLNPVSVSRFVDSTPFHGILFEGNNPYATVQVRLFGQFAFRVHFKTLSVDGPRFFYTHDLTADEEHVAYAAS